MGRVLKGAATPGALGLRSPFQIGTVFQLSLSGDKCWGALSEKGFLNLIRKWKPNGIATHQPFRNNTGQRKFCEEQPNTPGPSVSHRNATRNISLHVTMKKKTFKLDVVITYTVVDADLRQVDRIRVLGHT